MTTKTLLCDEAAMHALQQEMEEMTEDAILSTLFEVMPDVGISVLYPDTYDEESDEEHPPRALTVTCPTDEGLQTFFASAPDSIKFETRLLTAGHVLTIYETSLNHEAFNYYYNLIENKLNEIDEEGGMLTFLSQVSPGVFMQAHAASGGFEMLIQSDEVVDQLLDFMECNSITVPEAWRELLIENQIVFLQMESKLSEQIQQFTSIHDFEKAICTKLEEETPHGFYPDNNTLRPLSLLEYEQLMIKARELDKEDELELPPPNPFEMLPYRERVPEAEMLPVEPAPVYDYSVPDGTEVPRDFVLGCWLPPTDMKH